MSIKEKLKKHLGDMIVFLALLATSITLLVYYLLPRNEGDIYARVYHQNSIIYDEISLKGEDKQYSIDLEDGDNHIEMTIELKNHQIGITHSNCSNQYCVHQGFTSSPIKSLICSPNEVMVVLYSKNGSSMDSEFDL